MTLIELFGITEKLGISNILIDWLNESEEMTEEEIIEEFIYHYEI